MKTLLLVTACATAAPVLSQSVQPSGNSVFIQSSVASNTLSLLDSAIQYNNWNTTTNNWNLVHKYIYNYNSFYKEEAESMYFRSNNTWLQILRSGNYVYDANHNILEKVQENYSGGSWKQNSKRSYTYDGSNHMLTDLYQNYNTGSWVNFSNSVYTYSNNNRTSYIYQNWNTSTLAWDNLWHYSYTYNTADLLTATIQQTWVSGAWVNGSRTINYVYSGGDLIAYESETWDTITAAYKPKSKTSQTFDGNHRLQNALILKWNATTSSWDNAQKSDYTYAPDGSVSGFHFQDWDTISASWKNVYKAQYYYRTGYVGLNEHTPEKNSLVVYPNPSSNQISLFVSGKEAFSTVTIRDLSGKTVLVYETKQAGSYLISIETLQPGLYFVEGKNEQGSCNGKFIKN